MRPPPVRPPVGRVPLSIGPPGVHGHGGDPSCTRPIPSSVVRSGDAADARPGPQRAGRRPGVVGDAARGEETSVAKRLGFFWRHRRRVVVLAALLWITALTVGQVLGGGRLVVVPWLALGPLAASLVVPWVETAVVAVAAVTAVALLSASAHDLASGLGVVRVVGSAALAGFAVFGARVRVQRERRIRAMTQIATVAQTAIQHPAPAQVGGLALASRYVSASADALVGGDLFDVVATDRGARIIVGDVRGKGLPAVHIAASVLSAFRHIAPLAGSGLDEVARRIEAAISPGL